MRIFSPRMCLEVVSFTRQSLFYFVLFSPNIMGYSTHKPLEANLQLNYAASTSQVNLNIYSVLKVY